MKKQKHLKPRKSKPKRSRNGKRGRQGRQDRDFIGVAVGVVLVRNGKVLLLHRKNRREWGIPGGKIELNESGEACAVREIKEELGIDIKIKRFICVAEKLKPHWVLLTYEGEIIRGVPKIMEPEEHEKLAWFDIDNLPENTFAPSLMGIKAYKAMKLRMR